MKLIQENIDQLPKSYAKEADAWQLFKEGDQEAFALLYHQYFYLLYSYGSKFTADRGLVEDCIQDLFVKLFRNRQKLGNPVSVKNYLLKALRRMLQGALQTKHTMPIVSLEDTDFALSLSLEAQIEDQTLVVEQEQKVQAAVAMLSPRQKEVIYLRFYRKLSNEEIAEVMVLSLPSVYNIVSKALSVLEKHITPSLVLAFCIPILNS